MKTLIFACTLSGAFLGSPASATEVIEVTRENALEFLPGGKEADGIVGDFVLQNDQITALISGSLPLRRANMSTFYGDGNHTPGCLYDLTLRGEANDQLTVFAPCGQRGDVSWVKPVDDGVETYQSASRGKGIERRHVYTLDGKKVVVESTLTNKTGETLEVSIKDDTGRFRTTGRCEFVDWAEAIDPADRCGYAFERGGEGDVRKARKKSLAPGESVTITRALAVGRSPAAAVGELLGKHTLELDLFLENDRNSPAVDTAITFLHPTSKIPAYPNSEGRLLLSLPADVTGFKAESYGWEKTVGFVDKVPEALTVLVPPAGSAGFRIVDGASQRPIPCKVQFHGLDETENPDLGPMDRAHGCRDQFHSESGEFSLKLPPGKYRCVVTRGPEYSSFSKEFDIEMGGKVEIAGQLERVVDSPGWVSTDFHNHSTPSGDNTCGTDDRIINLAAEHLEFAPTTEHNRLYDWTPHIKRLGLAGDLATVAGVELTGRGTHMNCYPFIPDRFKQDGGAPVWNIDPRINALRMRHHQKDEPDRWIHVNHPNMTQNFIDRNLDGESDEGFVHLGKFIDAVEVQNFSGNDILAGAPYRLSEKMGKGGRVGYIREFIWLQLLNQGQDLKAIAVSDAHSVWGNGVGGWRTYVKSSTDDPAKIDWREMSRNSKEGKMILSNGPYLEVALRPSGGKKSEEVIAGGTLEGAQGTLHVKVQCTDWVDIDRVQILVNGAQNPAFNFTRKSHPELFADGVKKFEMDLPLQFSEDTHLIAVAFGENFDLTGGFGTSSQGRLRPCAYNNPIFMDVDGSGFKANGDTLGFPLPVGNLTPDQVRKFLQ